MTAYRFRVKFDPDPTSLWRDIVVGGQDDRRVPVGDQPRIRP